MKRYLGTWLSVVLFGLTVAVWHAKAASQEATGFTVLHIYIDSAEPLAAWQFELSERRGLMRVVGVENGDSPVYSSAPLYDLVAVQRGTERIIVADYSLAPKRELPRGRTRIASIHIQLSDSHAPDYALKLIAAAGFDGESLAASIEWQI